MTNSSRRDWMLAGMLIVVALPIIILQIKYVARPQSLAPIQAGAANDPLLERANATLALAQQTAQQTGAVLDLVQTLATIFGLLGLIATFVLARFGFEAQRGYQERMDAYQASLDEAQREQKTVRAKALQEIEAAQAEVRAATGALVLMSRGNQFLSEGKRDQAISAYEQARDLQPDDPDINYTLARAYSNAGRCQDAILVFEQALAARPAFAEAEMELGLAYRRYADTLAEPDRAVEYRHAEQHLRRAIQIRPNYEDALATLGGLYRRQGAYQKALDSYSDAALADRHSSYALGNVASLQWVLGEIERARQTFERVIRVANERIRTGRGLLFWDLYDRALAYLVLGQRDEAMDDYSRAIDLTTEAAHLYTTLHHLQFMQKAAAPIDGLDAVIERINAQLPQS